jgi:hypothetical protein
VSCRPSTPRRRRTDIERTPEERFEGLSTWPYEPRYATVGVGLRMHYVDVAWTGAWLDQLDLADITLFGQDRAG